MLFDLVNFFQNFARVAQFFCNVAAITNDRFDPRMTPFGSRKKNPETTTKKSKAHRSPDTCNQGFKIAGPLNILEEKSLKPQQKSRLNQALFRFFEAHTFSQLFKILKTTREKRQHGWVRCHRATVSPIYFSLGKETTTQSDKNNLQIMERQALARPKNY